MASITVAESATAAAAVIIRASVDCDTQFEVAASAEDFYDIV